MTRASGEDCHKVERYLRDKLMARRSSAYVKWKVLNIFKHVSMKGNPAFKTGLQRNADPIKDLVKYRGKKDPIKGDQPNAQVREAAKAAVKAIFSARKTATKANQGISSRMKGISSSSYGKVGTLSRGVKSAASNRPPIDRSAAPSGWSFTSNRGADSIHKRRDDYAAPGGSSSAEATRERIGRQGRTTTSTKPRRKGGVGGGWGSADVGGLKVIQRKKNSRGGRRENSASPTREQIRSARSRLVAMEVGKAVSDGVFERQIVDKLVAGGGIRAEIPKKRLAEFCLRCRTLDPRVVVPILEERLEAKKWQVRARTVALIAALGKDRGCKAFRELFGEMDSSWLADLLDSDSSKKVRRRVQETLLQLYPDEYEEADSDEEENEGSSGGGDLLAMGDGDGEDADFFDLSMGADDKSSKNAAATTTTTTSSSGGFDFITADDSTSNGDATSAPSGSGGFSFIDDKSSSVDPIDSVGKDEDAVDDLFSGMRIGGSDDASTDVPKSADVFGGLFSGVPAVASTSKPNSGMSSQGNSLDVFDQMNAMSGAARPSAAPMMMMMPPPTAPANGATNMMNYGRPMMGMPMMPTGGMMRPSSGTMMSPAVSNAAAASSQRRHSNASTGSSGGTGFGFMDEPKKKDAFDFVGDLMN